MSDINIGFKIEKNAEGYTQITPNVKLEGNVYASPYLRRAARGDYFELGFVIKHPGGTTYGQSPETILQRIPCKDIDKGIQIDGGITLGDINFDKLDEKGKKITENKSLKITGNVMGDDQVVFNGNLGQTAVEIDLGGGNDKIIAESKSKGGTVTANFGEGDDELVLVSGSNLKVKAATLKEKPESAYPETTTPVSSYTYIK